MKPITFVVWFIFLSIMDVVTTAMLLWMDPMAESNPLALAIYQSFGLWGLAIAKIISIGIVTLAVYRLPDRYRNVIYAIGLGALSFAAINNTYNVYVGLGVI